MSQPEKAIPQNQADAMPGGVTREVAVEDTTNDVVRYGDAANKAVRVNIVDTNGGSPIPISGTVIVASVGSFAFSDTYAAPANGVAINGIGPYSHFVLTVIAVGGITSWTVELQISMDGGSTWGVIATHTNVTGSGIPVAPSRPFPAVSVRTQCTALVLGAGVDITAYWRGAV